MTDYDDGELRFPAEPWYERTYETTADYEINGVTEVVIFAVRNGQMIEYHFPVRPGDESQFSAKLLIQDREVVGKLLSFNQAGRTKGIELNFTATLTHEGNGDDITDRLYWYRVVPEEVEEEE